MLQAVNLSVELAERSLFAGLSFSVSVGAALQITGSNGSGKTTLLRLLCGFNMPTTGQIYWDQQPITEAANFAGQAVYLGHQVGIRAQLTVDENIQRWQALFPCYPEVHRADLLNAFGLIAFADTLTGRLSAGQQRRAALTQLLLRKAMLWILDEPFTALDSTASQFLQQLMSQHAAKGGIVIFTSHQPVSLDMIKLQRLELTL